VRTLIANGTVVNADGSRRADVLVDGELIIAVEPGLAAVGADAVVAGGRVGPERVDRVIDASGRLVIPGAVDPHTHMELPVGNLVSKDTFETGTRAAAFGGTTTIIDFATQSRGGSLREGLDAWHAKADGRCCVDYGFHMAMCDVNATTLAEMDVLVAEGVSSFKLFTAYPGRMYSDDGAVLRAMFRAGENGGLILMHAENGFAVDVLAERLVAAGMTAPRYHALAHASSLEGEATHRVITLAEIAGVPVYVVHVSAAEAVEEIRAARARGAPVYGETCPQYLFLSADLLASDGHGRGGTAGDDFEGAKFVCSPPLRTPEHQAALWHGLGRGTIGTVGTDHCPFDYHGQKEIGRGDFRRIPNGLPGVEERVDLLHDGGVIGGLITRERWVDLVSATPARVFGLWGRKGAVAPGFDADLVVYDPAARHTLSARTHHMNVDYSCYEGREVRGACRVVMSRGDVVVENGEWMGRPGHGRFLERRPSEGRR
jgi:dihydropyrimidinase